jgi:hypothetical protein
MARIHRLTVAGLVLAGGLLPACTVSAGPVANWLGLCDCPPPCYYSPFRYWTPALARAYDAHRPHLSVYAPDRHPEIPPTYTILRYPCPPALPAATIIATPTPPPESRFRY